MKITVDILRKWNACKDGVRFFCRNFPNGLDLDKYTIVGDYKNWVGWLIQNSAARSFTDLDNFYLYNKE
ncbi:MAG TPA: hypothetical protein P5140_08765 [Methanofastidiosum sp.]|nr:hypothetical protein [Methanofastidiosum sp.]